MSNFSAQVQSNTTIPSRLTVQYFIRGLVSLAARRGHSLESLQAKLATEYNSTINR